MPNYFAYQEWTEMVALVLFPLLSLFAIALFVLCRRQPGVLRLALGGFLALVLIAGIRLSWQMRHKSIYIREEDTRIWLFLFLSMLHAMALATMLAGLNVAFANLSDKLFRSQSPPGSPPNSDDGLRSRQQPNDNIQDIRG